MEEQRMTDSKGPVITRNFMKKLSRGAIESIPLGGALLEQVIRRTLTSEASKEETAKLHTALLGIWDKLKGQDVKFIDIIGELEKEDILLKRLWVLGVQLGQVNLINAAWMMNFWLIFYINLKMRYTLS